MGRRHRFHVIMWSMYTSIGMLHTWNYVLRTVSSDSTFYTFESICWLRLYKILYEAGHSELIAFIRIP
jgi:hypothetical protein